MRRQGRGRGRRSEEGRGGRRSRGARKGRRRRRDEEIATRTPSGQIFSDLCLHEERTWLVLWAGNPVQTKDVSISSSDIVSLSSVALGRDQTDLGRKEMGKDMNEEQNR